MTPSLAFTVPSTLQRSTPSPLLVPLSSISSSSSASVSSATSVSSSSLLEEETRVQEATPDQRVIPPHKSLRHVLGVAHKDIHNTNKDSNKDTYRRRPKIVGHRGALHDCLENTRASFVRCLELGCDAVELDVFYLRHEPDPRQRLVVFHGGGGDVNPGDLTGHVFLSDSNDDDNTLQPNNILDLTYAQVQELRFCANQPEFACAPEEIEKGRIPMLRDVLLDLQDSTMQIKIELKDNGTVPAVLELVEELDMVAQCCYSSFDHVLLRQLRDLRPDATRYPTGALFTPQQVPPASPQLTSSLIQQARACGATQVHLPYASCHAQLIAGLHAAGLETMAWVRGPVGMREDARLAYWDMVQEDAESCYQALVDTRVGELCINRPDLALKLVATLEQDNRDNDETCDNMALQLPIQ